MTNLVGSLAGIHNALSLLNCPSPNPQLRCDPTQESRLPALVNVSAWKRCPSTGLYDCTSSSFPLEAFAKLWPTNVLPHNLC